MSITNGVKFFWKNRIDISFSATDFTATSNQSFASYIADRLVDTFWVSSGSDDTTMETLEITLQSPMEIDRLLLVRNNFLDFDVMYDAGSGYVHFANIVTKEGTQSNITETANAKTSNYYEFDAVTVTKVRIRVTKTQVANAEKVLYESIFTKEIGTFEGFHTIDNAIFGKARRLNRVISGRGITEKQIGAFSARITFNTMSSDNDATILETLDEFAQSFYVWLCGGNEAQFRTSRKGFRLRDIYLVQVTRDIGFSWNENLYYSGINSDLRLLEQIE